MERNVARWGQYGKAYEVTQRSWRLDSSNSTHGKMGRSDLVVPPPLANGWQWGGNKLSSSVTSPPPGKSVGHSSVKASEGKSELGSNMLSMLDLETSNYNN